MSFYQFQGIEQQCRGLPRRFQESRMHFEPYFRSILRLVHILYSLSFFHGRLGHECSVENASDLLSNPCGICRRTYRQKSVPSCPNFTLFNGIIQSIKSTTENPHALTVVERGDIYTLPLRDFQEEAIQIASSIWNRSRYDKPHYLCYTSGKSVVLEHPAIIEASNWFSADSSYPFFYYKDERSIELLVSLGVIEISESYPSSSRQIGPLIGHRFTPDKELLDRVRGQINDLVVADDASIRPEATMLLECGQFSLDVNGVGKIKIGRQWKVFCDLQFDTNYIGDHNIPSSNTGRLLYGIITKLCQAPNSHTIPIDDFLDEPYNLGEHSIRSAVATLNRHISNRSLAQQIKISFRGSHRIIIEFEE